MYVITVKPIDVSKEFSGACVYWAILVFTIRLIDVGLQGWKRPLPCTAQLWTDKHGDCVDLVCSYLQQEDEHQEAWVRYQATDKCPLPLKQKQKENLTRLDRLRRRAEAALRRLRAGRMGRFRI